MSTLYDLNINTVGRIHSLNTVNESTLRLSEMGLVPGSEVRMIKKNPFGTESSFGGKIEYEISHLTVIGVGGGRLSAPFPFSS